MFRLYVVSSFWVGSADPTCSEGAIDQPAKLGQENILLQRKDHKVLKAQEHIHQASDVRAFQPNTRNCVGGADTWNAGYGPCTTYAPDGPNYNFCREDSCDNFKASDVCPQCPEDGAAPAPTPDAMLGQDCGFDKPCGNTLFCNFDNGEAGGSCESCPSPEGEYVDCQNAGLVQNGLWNCEQLCVEDFAPPEEEPEQEFHFACIPANRAFMCMDVIPGQSSVSCNDMHLGNGADDVLMYLLQPEMVDGAPALMVFEIGSVFPTQAPEPLLTDISWNAVSSEVLHFNGVHDNQTIGILVKGESIPAGPSSGTWTNTHLPSEQEAQNWMLDNLITEEMDCVDEYQGLGGQMPAGMGLLSWRNKKTLVSKPKTAVSKKDFFADVAEEATAGSASVGQVEAVELTRKVKTTATRRRATQA